MLILRNGIHSTILLNNAPRATLIFFSNWNILSIIRISMSIIGGCLYMCRLDYSPLGRKLEVMDAGFSAYCGFIHLEAMHRNPIMLAVASYLYGRMKAKQQCSVEVKRQGLFIESDPKMVFGSSDVTKSCLGIPTEESACRSVKDRRKTLRKAEEALVMYCPNEPSGKSDFRD